MNVYKVKSRGVISNFLVQADTVVEATMLGTAKFKEAIDKDKADELKNHREYRKNHPESDYSAMSDEELVGHYDDYLITAVEFVGSLDES